MDPAAVCLLSASEIGQLLRSGEASPVEVTRAFLDRIGRLDGRLRSYIMVAGEDALRQAQAAERDMAAGRDRGPLHGVPVAVKDHCNVSGWPSTGGSAILKDNVPHFDSTVVARLREGGAVLLGKLNMTEFGIAETIDFPYGQTANPWRPDRSPGSSSAGPGAATAAFLCAASLGGDTGGSIRIPAAYCGIVGLKPTWGLVSRYGVMPVTWSMDTTGPMTRTVEDCALMLQAVAGHNPKDRHTRKGAVPDYRAALDGGVRGLRMGLITELIDPAVVDIEVADAVREAARELEGLGASVDDVSIPMVAHAGAIHWTLCYVEFCAVNREMIRTRAADMTHMVRVAVQAGSLVPG